MRAWRAGIAGFALLAYLAFPTKNYYWDGISFAQTIEDAHRWPDLLHPNHLLYNLTGALAYRALGGQIRALYVLQAMNALWGALAVYWLTGVLAQILKSPRAVLLLGALFAFAGTWWRYATDAGAYIPSIAVLIVCAGLLLPGQRPRPILVALLHSAAMLIHQLGLFLLAAAVYALWRQDRERRQRNIGVYAGLAGALTAGAYAAGFTALYGRFSFGGLWTWMTSYAEDARFSFDLLRDAGLFLRGWVQVFFVGRPSLLSSTGALGTVFLLLLCGAVLVVFLLALRRVHWRVRLHQPLLLRFALLWVASYALFLFFWQPQNTFYKIFALPGILLAIASCWDPDKDPPWSGTAMSFVALLTLLNLTLGLLPYSRVSSNDVVAFAQGLRLTPGSVVFYRAFNTDDWYARYFNAGTQWRAADSTAAIDSELRAGRPVWLETTATDVYEREDPAWFGNRSTERRELIKPSRRMRFVRLAAP